MIRWLIGKILGFRGMTVAEARDWTAILFTPVLTACGAGVALIVWLGPWPEETARQRLDYLGWTLIGLLFLIGLGTMFLQRRTVNVKAETPAGSFEVENVTPES